MPNGLHYRSAGEPTGETGELSRVEKAAKTEPTAISVHVVLGFVNATQCVRLALPLRWPNSGRAGVSFRTSEIGICTDDHLKISVPSGAKTRKHSAKPPRNIERQSPSSAPYFARSQEFGPLLSKCGGSNTTSPKRSDGNGSAVKSEMTPGKITNSRWPPFTDESFSMCRSARLSQKITRSSDLSNQNILEPQHTSRIVFSAIVHLCLEAQRFALPACGTGNCPIMTLTATRQVYARVSPRLF